MKSFEFDVVRVPAPARIVRAVRTLGEYKGKEELFARQTPQVLEALRKNAVIESAESSNRIEGVTAEEGRLQAIVVAHDAPLNRSEAEIAGYRDVLETIHTNHDAIIVAERCARGETPFSVELVLQLHRDSVDVEARCPDLGRDMIRRVLRGMRDAGRVRSEGAGAAAVWRKLPLFHERSAG